VSMVTKGGSNINDKPENGITISEPYLAFIDGSLNYDCIACPDNCCKGHGFGGMEDGAISVLIDNHPELLPWIQSRDKGFIDLSTPSGGCLFLQNNGLCKIEITYGRDAKPGICLMFPFNNMQRVDNHLILRPQFLCKQFEPVIPPRPGFVNGSHATIIKDLHATAMNKRSLPQTTIHANDSAQKALAREKKFLELCSSALGSERALDTVKKFSADANELSGFVSRALRLLGINASQGNRQKDRFDDLLHILLPSMRTAYLALPPEGILFSIFLAESLCRDSFIGMERLPTLADLASFFSVMQPTLNVLGYLEEPFGPLIGWQPDGSRPALESADHKMALGVMIVLTGKGFGTLQSLEEALFGISRPLERLLFIRRLATLLKHRHPESNENEKNIPQNRKQSFRSI
jgi:hypothetical protein